MSAPAPSGTHVRRVMPVIVIAQFLCTSLWFAGNAVIAAIEAQWHLPSGASGAVLSSVQAGFVAGTLLFAVLSLSDRFAAPAVFLTCAILGALSNLAIVLVCDGLFSLIVARFLTGFFLAGIYPVGMKIAASWSAKGLGKALGYLVGALVCGTALPHLLRGLGTGLPWTVVITCCSVASLIGGVLIYRLVPTGPFLPARSPFVPSALARIFGVSRLRSAALGYFGHMWELYAFWAFVPLIIQHYAQIHGMPSVNVSLMGAIVIGAGAVGCVVGGELAGRVGSDRVAFVMLLVSGLACLVSPWMFSAGALGFAAFLLVWGFAVAGDSPQFSTLVGGNAPREYVGTAFTVVNCIGFAITTVSIHVLEALSTRIPIEFLLLPLAIGPIVGLISAAPLLRRMPATALA